MIIAAAVAAVGLLLLGLCLKAGIDNFVNKDRMVTVKGLAEMQVDADKVTWPIVTRESGNDIKTLYAMVSRKNASIVEFLKQNGITDEEINVNPIEVDDREMNEYANERVPYRYRARSVITVISNKVSKVREITAKQDELLERGIVIESGEGPSISRAVRQEHRQRVGQDGDCRAGRVLYRRPGQQHPLQEVAAGGVDHHLSFRLNSQRRKKEMGRPARGASHFSLFTLAALLFHAGVDEV